jgi:hypothetical protein
MSQWDDRGAADGTPEISKPVAYEQNVYRPTTGPSPADSGGWTHDETRQRPQPENQRIWPDQSWPPRKPLKRRPPKWVLPVLAGVIGAAVAVELVLVLGGKSGHPGPGQSTSPSALAKKTGHAKTTGPAAPLTMAEAKTVLAGYDDTINKADAAFSPSVLGTADGQGSYALIAGGYKQQQASRSKPTAAYTSQSPQFYIPLESAAYPHWFAVQVDNVTTGNKPANLGTRYLVFQQSSAGSNWQEVDQPRTLGTPPTVVVSSAGYATAISSSAPGYTIAPDQLAADTAGSLDGHGGLPNPGNLADINDAAGWRHGLPKGSTLSLTHTAAHYPVYALQTTGGGALVFYTDDAQVSMKPARKKTLKLSVPGYYTSKQRLKSANLSFVEQFAAYDPPVTIPGLSIVGDASGLAP